MFFFFFLIVASPGGNRNRISYPNATYPSPGRACVGEAEEEWLNMRRKSFDVKKKNKNILRIIIIVSLSAVKLIDIYRPFVFFFFFTLENAT